MKSGTVVIGSKSGNIGDLVKRVDPRLLVDKPKPKLFAKTILNFFNLSSEEKNKMYKKSVNLAKTFDWNNKSGELENYFYQILNKSNSR
jgi:hypothetical protein